MSSSADSVGIGTEAESPTDPAGLSNAWSTSGHCSPSSSIAAIGSVSGPSSSDPHGSSPEIGGEPVSGGADGTSGGTAAAAELVDDDGARDLAPRSPSGPAGLTDPSGLADEAVGLRARSAALIDVAARLTGSA